MEFEYFDEPRRCDECQVVTYCDRCPICGKLLPRSNRFQWRLSRVNHIAGEEQIAQPKNHEVHRGHLKQRELKDKYTSIHPYESAAHVEPDIEISSGKTHTYRSQKPIRNRKNTSRQMTARKRQGTIIFFVVFFILASIVASIFAVISDIEFNISTEEDNPIVVHANLDERRAIRDNQGEIEVYDYMFDSTEDESILSIINNGDRCFYTDVYLYNEDDEEIGSFAHLFVLPYEEFDLSMVSFEEASSYEMKNYAFYEINSTKPDFSYQTYNDFGKVDVYLDEELSQKDLEIMTQYFYEAGLKVEGESIYSLLIHTNSENIYEVYYADDMANIYCLDEDGSVQEAYDLVLKK